jgi:outer membrane protein assembly factor BamB
LCSPGSRSVPTIDEDYIYTCGPYGDLYCLDVNTHQPVWHKNVWTDFGGDPGNDSIAQAGGRGGFGGKGNFPIWAISQCPLIYGDLLIIASQAPGAGVVAYNKTTGEVVWKTENLGNETYVSPAIVKIDGADHVVMITSSTNPIGRSEAPQTPGNITGIEPLTGKILWNYSGWDCHIAVPSAVDAGNNKILVVGGYEYGALMIQVEEKEDGSFDTKEIFKTVEFGDQTKPPLLIDGYFYAQYGTNNRRDGLICMNIDGEIMWKTKREPNFNKGSMILADGLLLVSLTKNLVKFYKSISTIEHLDSTFNCNIIVKTIQKRGVIDKKEAEKLRIPYFCWSNLKSKALNKKNASIATVPSQRKMEFVTINKSINVMPEANNL